MKKSLISLFNIVNVILYFVVVALWLSVSDEIQLCLFVSGATIVMSLVLIIIQRDRFKDLYSSHFFKEFTNTVVQAFLIFCILGLVNYLAFKNPLKKDYTNYNNNSLSEQTVKVVKSVKEKVNVKIFSDKTFFPNIKALFELYRQESSLFEYEFIDAAIRPDLVNKEGITQVPALVVEMSGKKQTVLNIRELEITNALIKLTRDKLPVVYFLTNHLGPSIADESDQGLSYLKNFISKLAYTVKELDLLAAGEVPKDADVLVIWGPKTGFDKNEISALESYMRSGKSLLVSLDPMLNGDVLSDLRNFLITWGVRVSNNIVVDKGSFIRGSNGLAPIVQDFSKHKISDGFNGQLFFPVSSAIEFADSPLHKGSFQYLARSSGESWAENDFNEVANGQVEFTEGVDKLGPIALAGTWTGHGAEGERPSRIVAFGNSTFVTNQYGRMVGNYLFLTSAVDWLSGRDLISSFDRPELKEEPVFIGGPQVGIIFYFSVLFLPIVFIIASILFYRKRRLL
ncbi:hypothetical protein M899_1111 [Bacteriovorax sp. BSW11_IV]|uniref:GldG family protein n=1 Tax=Bacteriovorax sp. BSW11_IV TaxID=1353529 RepID=UPI00038A1697|nr:Gldg family protein [Bacteriovorax sp. BSW11_IV]EQC46715.1 hypothetical protein M899_1111 [Bacteriovorax sp. BSW11_IV]